MPIRNRKYCRYKKAAPDRNFVLSSEDKLSVKWRERSRQTGPEVCWESKIIVKNPEQMKKKRN